jgi:hypothetical protein
MARGRWLLVTFAASAVLAARLSAHDAEGQGGGQEEYFTGAEPVDPKTYAELPKLSRHRAWLPKVVDLSGEFPIPGYQGRQPNCVAWATTYAARSYLYGRDIGRRPAATEALSPAYVYNRLRPEGSACAGAIRLTDALTLLQKEGTVSLADWPDDLSNCQTPAPVALRGKAGQYRIAEWRAVDREKPNDWQSPLVLDDVKGTLARGVPLVFAMPVDDAFFAYKGVGNYVPGSVNSGKYHAMSLVGYDEDRQAFRAINSWGTRWGDKGYFWISYTDFRRLTGEAYALEAPVAKANTPPPSPKQQFQTAMAGLQCGSVSVKQVGGRQVIAGFGGVQGSMNELHRAAMLVDPKTDWQVQHHPWPQCEAEMTLGPALANDGGVSVRAVDGQGGAREGDPVAMRRGEKFGFVATATQAKPYLSIIYLQADGSAVELYRGQPAQGAGGRREVMLGTGGEKAVRFEVGAPFGNEMLVALASARPLFGQELSTYATERQFLTGLRARLLAQPAGSVSGAVLRLKTAA